jgi:hypothetical protein
LTILDDDIGEFITASQNVSLLWLGLPFAILCGNRAFVLGLVILRFPFIFFASSFLAWQSLVVVTVAGWALDGGDCIRYGGRTGRAFAEIGWKLPDRSHSCFSQTGG